MFENAVLVYAEALFAEVSPQQFCWACICFLGTVLAVQALARQ